MMTRGHGLWVAAFFVSSLATACAGAATLRESLEKKIKASGVPLKELGLAIVQSDGSQSKVILDINAKALMIPASITKIATASAVLEAFPPGTKFKTGLWSEASSKNGALAGDLYLKGGGDPGFVSENMWFLVNQFVRTGLKTIEGDLVVDDSLFDDVRYDESRQEARVDRAYDAPVGAMSFNWNSINVYVRPGAEGKPAEVFLDPENSYTRLVNKAITVRGDVNTLAVDRDRDKDGDVVTVSGRIGTAKTEVVIYKSITRPDLWSGHHLKSFLAQRGVVVKGKIRAGRTPEKAALLAEAESKPIEQAVSDMNKFSNNYVAEMLCKQLGALGKSPATLKSGMDRVNDHLRGLGLTDKEFLLTNPSGLNRENRFTADGMVKVLLHLRQNFQIQPEFLTSLPIASVDGTLKRRFVGTRGERWVRAKTGLLTGVVALAGYAGRPDGTVYTFAFIANGRTNEARLRQLFDEWLQELLK